MSQSSPGAGGQAEPPVCPRHPDRISYVSCQRCERPVCTECQVPAAVGVHCRDCQRQAAARIAAPKTVVGARLNSGRPVVTFTLMAITVVVFLLQYIPLLRVTEYLALVPGYTFVQPWRLLSAALVHSTQNPMHIGFNLLGLWIFGQYLEPVLGRARFLLSYLVSGLGASTFVVALASLTDDWLVWTVGASGAIFGLFGIALFILVKTRQNMTPMLVLIGLNVVMGFLLPNVSWQPHLGGLITGLIIGLALVKAPAANRSIFQFGAITGLGLVQLAIVYLSFAL